MSITAVHVGDIGTVFELTIYDGSSVVDISSATTKQITLQTPTGTSTTYTAVFSGTGTDGKIKYTTTTALILSVAGMWKIQGVVVMPAGTWHTSVETFQVHPNL